MAIPYSKKMLIQRIRKHVADGFANDSFSASENEILLYVDQSVAQQIKGAAYENAKVEGMLAIPEAFLVTLQLTSLLQDEASGYWYATLPQPPLGLPLGYSINQVYSKAAGSGVSEPFFMIKAKRVPRRENMPVPTGIRCWIENSFIWFVASNGSSLQGMPVFVQMPINRTSDVNAPMNLPDDAIENIFNDVTTWLNKRYAEPKDIIADNLPAGNNNLKQ